MSGKPKSSKAIVIQRGSREPTHVGLVFDNENIGYGIGLMGAPAIEGLEEPRRLVVADSWASSRNLALAPRRSGSESICRWASSRACTEPRSPRGSRTPAGPAPRPSVYGHGSPRLPSETCETRHPNGQFIR